MRAVATVMQTSGGNMIPWPTVDETAVEGEIVPENTAATTGDFNFGTTNIGAYKFSSKIVTIPFELLQDQGPGFDIEAFTRRALATRIARITNRLFTTGTGTGQPQGIVTATGIGKVGLTGQTAAVLPDDLVDLEHSVDPAYRSMPGVGWMWHDTTLRQLKKLKDSQGRPLWLPGFSTDDAREGRASVASTTWRKRGRWSSAATSSAGRSSIGRTIMMAERAEERKNRANVRARVADCSRSVHAVSARVSQATWKTVVVDC